MINRIQTAALLSLNLACSDSGSGDLLPRRLQEPLPCAPSAHPWAKAAASQASLVVLSAAPDALAAALMELEAGKTQTFILAAANYHAAAIPSGVNVSIIGACGASIVDGLMTVGEGATLRITETGLAAGLAAQGATSVTIQTVQIANPNGVGITVEGGSLSVVHSEFGSIASHAIEGHDTTGLTIDDNNFLGPLGGDGIYSRGNNNHFTVHRNRFGTMLGAGLRCVAPKSGLEAITVDDNNFLGPLGGDAIYSSAGPSLNIRGNRFAEVAANGVFSIDARGAIVIDDNNFLGPLGGDGIYARSALGGALRGNQFAAISGNAISIIGSQGSLRVDDNIFLGPLGGDGIYSRELEGSETFGVARNAIDNAGRFGLFIADSSAPLVIHGNRISASGQRGILLQDLSVGAIAVVGNTVLGSRASGIEVLGVTAQVELARNFVDKVHNDEIGGLMAPGVGFGITVIDSAKAHIHYNMISRTALSGIVVDLAQWAQVSDYSTANLEVGCNHFDGLAKYDIVIQNTAQFTVRGDDMSLGNQAPGYGERFPVARRRAGDRRCGDGAVDEGEGCDDGNRIDTDACTNHCQPARCGDAIVRTDHNANDPAHEACDFGADNLLCVACSIVRSNRLALGADHACALRNGMVYCWGSNADQQLGMRGTNDCVDQGNCSAHALVTEFSNAIGVVAGEHHSCAYNDEQMRCFGRSLHGALMGSSRQGASFTTRFRIAPTLLAAGGSATCYRIGTGVTKCAGRLHPNGSEIIDPAAMFENANLNDLRLGPSHYCWRNTEGISCTGSNQDGAISDNSASHAEGVNIDPRHDVQVAVGDRITCIIDAAQNLACRGSDRGGRLGRGGDGHCERRRNCAATMAPVHNLGGVVQVALGSHHTCALDHRGRVTCWGQNLTASQGIDGEEFQTTPGDPVPLPAPAAEVRAGRFHSCAFSIDERVFCWGSNNLGQVGNGVLSGTEPPTEVQFSE